MAEVIMIQEKEGFRGDLEESQRRVLRGTEKKFANNDR
jgi:ribosomal protein S28E/S33